ncbi:MAG: LTA synthase family protein [Synergistaceae bacterium]|nr:LTA synthase family protein [Synergistaceae bacterium]
MRVTLLESLKNRFVGKELALSGLLALAVSLKFVNLNNTLMRGSLEDPLTLLALVGTSLALASLPLLLPRRFRGAGMLFVDFWLTVLVWTDLLSLRYYSDLFTLRNLGLGTQLSAVADSVVALMEPKDALLWLDFPVLGYLACRLTGRSRELPALDRIRSGAVLALVAIFLVPFGLRVQRFEKTCPGALASMWDRPAVALSLGSLNYHLADLLSIASETFRARKPATDLEEVAGWFQERPGTEAHRYHGIAAGKNLIVIQVEALQAFVLNRSVGGVEITPNLNRLARRGLSFTETYHQTAMGNSADAEFLVNTGLFPAPTGVAYTRYAGNEFNSIASALKAKGYSTIALHGDRPGFWNRARMYPSLSFDRFVSNRDFQVDSIIGLGLSDESFFRQSLPILKAQKQPFYAFLITLSSHYPFNMDLQKIPELPLGELAGTQLGNYLRCIHYADAQIGAFVDGLRREGLLDESVLAVYGDHPGLTVADQPDLARFLGVLDVSDPVAWKKAQKIPFIVRLPRGRLRGQFSLAAGQIDIGPTLGNLMGTDLPTAFGQDLLNTDRGFVVFRNGSFLDDETWVLPEQNLAYDLKTGKARALPEPPEELARARQKLIFSDAILQGNLIPRLNASFQ